MGRSCQCAHTCATRHVLTTFGRIAENAKPEDDGVPFFCMGSKRIAPGPSPPPKTRLAGAGEALSYPTGAPHPHTAPAQPT